MRHSTYSLYESVEVKHTLFMQIYLVLTRSSHIQAFSAASLPLIADAGSLTLAGSSQLSTSGNLQEIAPTHLSDKETLELKKITH